MNLDVGEKFRRLGDFARKKIFLMDATEAQVKGFAALIGDGVIEEIKRKGLTLKYYSYQGNDKHYMLDFSGKALLFHIGRRDIRNGREFIDVSFIPSSYVDGTGTGLRSGAFTAVGRNLQEGTLEFLRKAGEILTESDGPAISIFTPHLKEENVFTGITLRNMGSRIFL